MIALTLHVWRQDGPNDTGRFETHHMTDIDEDSSFLETMDLLNEQIATAGEIPITFDSDCREGICGACSMVLNGRAHGPGQLRTTCEVRMRQFNDGDKVWVEPFEKANLGHYVAVDMPQDLEQTHIIDGTGRGRVSKCGRGLAHTHA